MERIHEHAVIGDGRTAALVTRSGVIDWLCWPRFDSPAVFARLLDEGAGHWSLAPCAPFRSERRYLPDTNVLATRFVTDSGEVEVKDFMPIASEQEKRRHMMPDHEILRLVSCVRGEVEIETVFEPRPGWGRERPRLRDRGSLGIRAETRAGLLTLRADLPLRIVGPARVTGRESLREGDERHLALCLADEWPAVLPPLGAPSHEALARTVAWWRDWVARMEYEGPGREHVVRSALALKLLVYAPSGAVVAAATSSLPERVGGDLNWDYRFCWLRDASLTTRALFGLGFTREADAFVSWLLHSTRLDQPELRVLYDVHGKTPAAERTLDHLAGYRGSRPVRVGNGAAEQLQLDVHGEVIDAVAHFVGSGGHLDGETQRLLRALGDYVCRNWHRPDEGIWEPRSGRSHHTHSRVLCWTALDRLLSLHAGGHLRGLRVDEVERTRAAIREDVEKRAWNEAMGSYASVLDGSSLDAALLLIPWYGFEPGSSERVRGTVRAIRERLGTPSGLVHRYLDGESPGEGAFGICSFWAAEALALGAGTVEEATEAFLAVCAHANDVGLFAEEMDPGTGEALGNFPQAFTHVGLVNAALSLHERMRGGEPRPKVGRRPPGDEGEPEVVR